MKEMSLVPTAVNYNTLFDFDGYCSKGDLEMAFCYRDEKIEPGIMPTVSIYHLLIHALFMEGRMVEADHLVCNATEAFDLHDEMLRKRMKEADDLFEKITGKGVSPDIIMFNALIDGHCANGHCREVRVKETHKLLDEMKGRGIKPDHISYNTLISGYSRQGDLKDAFRVHDEMLNLGFNPTFLTYNALIQGLFKNQEEDLGEELLQEMVSKGITSDDSIYYALTKGMSKVNPAMESSNPA
ncbi:hypothetical protein SLEP1_g33430 [Rubroshorea leprosula]|uniref:Pentatricopeptide repeat-containing protein n=1 Tax=Rubroshorea leprosula TaxID=152421 RepID=A0AAV5KGM4_9ROSI|nr:hypothetical protein SLEP1_g33430 [Rubroshorea leprosula]